MDITEAIENSYAGKTRKKIFLGIYNLIKYEKFPMQRKRLLELANNSDMGNHNFWIGMSWLQIQGFIEVKPIELNDKLELEYLLIE